MITNPMFISVKHLVIDENIIEVRIVYLFPKALLHGVAILSWR